MSDSKFTIHAINKEGFHVEIEGTYPEAYDLTVGRLIDPDFGFAPYLSVVTGPGGKVQSVTQVGAVDPEIECQFCGKEVTGTPKIGNRGPYSAKDVARSRSEKMGKLGKEAKPVCGNCWNKAGWKSRWDEYYSANS